MYIGLQCHCILLLLIIGIDGTKVSNEIASSLVLLSLLLSLSGAG
jgi:hypothetical protein